MRGWEEEKIEERRFGQAWVEGVAQGGVQLAAIPLLAGLAGNRGGGGPSILAALATHSWDLGIRSMSKDLARSESRVCSVLGMWRPL